jgi:hypothetical protein
MGALKKQSRFPKNSRPGRMRSHRNPVLDVRGRLFDCCESKNLKGKFNVGDFVDQSLHKQVAKN